MNENNLTNLPHDIYGLTDDLGFWWAGLIGAVIIIAIIVAAVWFFMKKFRGKSAVEIIKEENKLETLKKKLENLEPMEPFDKKTREEFFFLLSLIFRNVIELCTGFCATDKTFQELKKSLRNNLSMFDDSEINLIINFLNESDMIKFAEEEINFARAKEFKSQVSSWVEALINFKIAKDKEKEELLKTKNEN